MQLVITYDIADDKRRTKIHKVLKSYGQWMQFSVFECLDLSDAEYAKLSGAENFFESHDRRFRWLK